MGFDRVSQKKVKSRDETIKQSTSMSTVRDESLYVQNIADVQKKKKQEFLSTSEKCGVYRDFIRSKYRL